METEVCAYSLESCHAAREGGATRVELCSGMAEGGTTPSWATIRLARAIPGLQLSVMIRPRGGDFLYSDLEFEQMTLDIEQAKACGADAVVLGLLTPDGDIDKERTTRLVQLASPMTVVFHRAFDMARDWQTALEDIIDCGCRRILTSGGKNTAMEGIDTLRDIVTRASGRIEIMAGSGVNPANTLPLADTGVDALHFSARSLRDSGMIYRNPRVSMGGTDVIGEYDIAYSRPGTIREIVTLLASRP